MPMKNRLGSGNTSLDIGIVLPPTARGLGMIKSFPLDVSHLIGWLKEKQSFSVELIDYRPHSINNDNFWISKGVDINVFSDFSSCIRHLKGEENPRIQRTALRVLQDFKPARFSHSFLSVSVFEQLFLEYLIVALCLAKEIRLLYPNNKIARRNAFLS